MTSYTSTISLQDERHQTLHEAIVKLCLEMRPMDGPPAEIRTDPAPGFRALVNDPLLKKHRVTIELGHAKNPYKNPITTSALNSRIRLRGLSLREMWTQRDRFSNQQLPLADDHLVAPQHKQRLSNHPYSECSKAPLTLPHPTPFVDVGDLDHLHSDRNKSRVRDRYLVVAIDPPFCDIIKFIGSQLRSSSYHVKLSECFKVPSDFTTTSRIPPPPVLRTGLR